MHPWWQSFFDADYLKIWGGFVTGDRTRQEAADLWQLLGLKNGSRVLDAPCGYGRLSRALAERGAVVTGVDQSEFRIDEGERTRDGLSSAQLRYLRHDLRVPLGEGGFDAAINMYSSLGYGTEEDDVAMLATLRGAVRPGGLVLVETNHRDAAVALLSRGGSLSTRLSDGTLVVEQPRLDALAGRVETCWYWSGPNGSGSKPASIRVYTATELIRLMERAGLRFRSAHRGCSPDPFHAAGPEMGGRLGLLAERA